MTCRQFYAKLQLRAESRNPALSPQKNYLDYIIILEPNLRFTQNEGLPPAVIRWRFSVMFSRRFAVMSFGLMLFALCSVLHKVSSVPQGISDKKHNFVLCRAIFCLCGNRFRFLCFVISYKKAQKSRPAIKGFASIPGGLLCRHLFPVRKALFSVILFQPF